MPASISFVMKTSILLSLLVSVYFTVNSEMDAARKTKYQIELNDIAKYVEGKLLRGLKEVNSFNSNSSQVLMLPHTDFFYNVSLTCNEFLEIRVTSQLDRKSIIKEFLNCSMIEANGSVVEGEKCLKVEKLNETYLRISLVNKCETQ